MEYKLTRVKTGHGRRLVSVNRQPDRDKGMYKNHEADEMMVQLKGRMERGVIDASREVARAL